MGKEEHRGWWRRGRGRDLDRGGQRCRGRREGGRKKDGKGGGVGLVGRKSVWCVDVSRWEFFFFCVFSR